MKIKLLVCTLAFVFLSFDKTVDDVYICGAKCAKKYHLVSNCRGLSACKHEIFKTSLQEAQNLGLEICGWED